MALTEDPPWLELGVYSDDLLKTLYLYGYGKYNLNEKTFGGGGTLLCRAFYPVISLNGGYEQRNLNGLRWDSLGAGLGLTLPLDFSLGLWNRELEIGVSGDYYKYSGHVDITEDFLVSGGIVWSSYLRSGYRRIFPYLGIYGDFQFSRSLTGDDEVYTLLSSAAFPGLFRNNSLRLTAGGEIRRGLLASGLAFCRGWDSIGGEKSLSVSLDYDFPLLYPDIPLYLAFIKRVRGNLYGQSYWLDGEFYNSAGGALFLDSSLLNMEYLMMNIGLRFYYRINDSRFGWSVVIDGSNVFQ